MITKLDTQIEIIAERTARQKVFDNGDGSKRYVISTGDLHYQNADGDWQDVYLTLKTEEVAGKTYSSQTIIRDNKITVGFRGDGLSYKFCGLRTQQQEQLEFTLHSIKFDNQDVLVPEQFLSYTLVAENAIEHQISDDVSLHTRVGGNAIKTAIKLSSHIDDFEIVYKVHLNGLTIENQLIDSEYEATSDGFAFVGSERFIISQPMMWNEAGSFSGGIDHSLYVEDGILYYKKVTNQDGQDWLVLNSLPVYIDATVIYSSTSDGYIQGPTTTNNWAGAHDATSGTVYTGDAQASGVRADGVEDKSDVRNYVNRSFFIFDTSTITGTVTSAILGLYQYAGYTANAVVCAQKGTQSNPLVSGDFVAFTGDHFGTVTTSGTTGQYWTISFNQTGLNAITKLGTTKICAREYTHDYLNVSPGTSGYLLYFCFADAAAGTRPYLDITVSPNSTYNAGVLNLNGSIGATAHGGSGKSVGIINTSLAQFDPADIFTEQRQAIQPVHYSLQEPEIKTEWQWCIGVDSAYQPDVTVVVDKLNLTVSLLKATQLVLKQFGSSQIAMSQKEASYLTISHPTKLQVNLSLCLPEWKIIVPVRNTPVATVTFCQPTVWVGTIVNVGTLSLNTAQAANPEILKNSFMPDGDEQINSWRTNSGGSTNLYDEINEPTFDASKYIYSNTAADACYFTMQDMPINFDHAISVTISIVCSHTMGSTLQIGSVQLLQSDGSTAVTAAATITSAVAPNLYTVTPAITGLTDKTTWDGIVLKIMTGDSGTGTVRVYAAGITVTYSIGTTINIVSAVDGDYPDLQSWFNATQGFCGHYIAELRDESYVGFDASDSWQTTENDYYEVRAITGLEFRGVFNDASPSYPIITSASPYCINITGQVGFTIRNVVLSQDSTEAIAIGLYGPAEAVVVDTCGFDIATVYDGSEDCVAAGIFCNIRVDDNSWTVKDSVFRNISATSSNPSITDTGAIGIYATYDGSATGYVNVYNSIFYRLHSSAVGGTQTANGLIVGLAGMGVSTANLYNTYFGCPILEGTGTHSDYTEVDIVECNTKNISNNAVATGGTLQNTTNQQTDVVPANEFLNTTLATLDVHLLETSQKLKMRGTSLAEISDAPTVDMDGESWTGFWSIGADKVIQVHASVQRINGGIFIPSIQAKDTYRYLDPLNVVLGPQTPYFSTTVALNSSQSLNANVRQATAHGGTGVVLDKVSLNLAESSPAVFYDYELTPLVQHLDVSFFTPYHSTEIGLNNFGAVSLSLLDPVVSIGTNVAVDTINFDLKLPYKWMPYSPLFQEISVLQPSIDKDWNMVLDSVNSTQIGVLSPTVVLTQTPPAQVIVNGVLKPLLLTRGVVEETNMAIQPVSPHVQLSWTVHPSSTSIAFVSKSPNPQLIATPVAQNISLVSQEPIVKISYQLPKQSSSVVLPQLSAHGGITVSVGVLTLNSRIRDRMGTVKWLSTPQVINSKQIAPDYFIKRRVARLALNLASPIPVYRADHFFVLGSRRLLTIVPKRPKVNNDVTYDADVLILSTDLELPMVRAYYPAEKQSGMVSQFDMHVSGNANINVSPFVIGVSQHIAMMPFRFGISVKRPKYLAAIVGSGGAEGGGTMNIGMTYKVPVILLRMNAPKTSPIVMPLLKLNTTVFTPAQAGVRERLTQYSNLSLRRPRYVVSLKATGGAEGSGYSMVNTFIKADRLLLTATQIIPEIQHDSRVTLPNSRITNVQQKRPKLIVGITGSGGGEGTGASHIAVLVKVGLTRLGVSQIRPFIQYDQQRVESTFNLNVSTKSPRRIIVFYPTGGGEGTGTSIIAVNTTARVGLMTLGLSPNQPSILHDSYKLVPKFNMNVAAKSPRGIIVVFYPSGGAEGDGAANYEFVTAIKMERLTLGVSQVQPTIEHDFRKVVPTIGLSVVSKAASQIVIIEPKGGAESSGQAIISNVIKVQLMTIGILPQQPRIEYDFHKFVPTININLASKSPHQVYIFRPSGGGEGGGQASIGNVTVGLLTLGVSQAQPTVARDFYKSVSLLHVNLDAKPLSQIIVFSPTGGAEGAGEAIISVVEFVFYPSGGAEASGEAIVDTNEFVIIPKGGAEGGGQAQGGALMSANKQFLFNRGECTDYYWQVEGACAKLRCFYYVDGEWNALYYDSSAGLNGRACNQNLQMIVIVQGCSLKDICEKLIDKNFDFPISRISRFSQPVNTNVPFTGCATYEQVYPPVDGTDGNFEIPVDCLQYFVGEASESIWGAYFDVEWSGEINSENGIMLGADGDIMLQTYVMEEEEGISVEGEGYATFIEPESGQFESVCGIIDELVEIEGGIPTDEGEDFLEETVGVVTQCGCGTVSATVEVRHNLGSATKLAMFLKRNNLTLPSTISLYYNTVTASWLSNLHYTGLSNDNITRESWNIIMEWSCVDSVATIPSGLIWKLSVYVRQKNLTTGEDFDTRILLVFEVGYVCPDRSDLDYSVTLDTQNQILMTEGQSLVNASLNVCTDNVGLFESSSWLSNPYLLLRLYSNEFFENVTYVNYSPLLTGVDM